MLGRRKLELGFKGLGYRSSRATSLSFRRRYRYCVDGSFQFELLFFAPEELILFMFSLKKLLRSKYFGVTRLAVVALTIPVAGFCTAIQAIGTVGTTVCEVGTCPVADTQATSLGLNQSSSGSFDFTYTFTNGDQFLVAGTYSNSYDNNGSHVEFLPDVTYTGNNGNTHAASAGIDILSLIMLENFYDPEVSPWDGNACEHFPVTLPSNTAASATLSYGGLPIATLSAAGPGYTNQSACNYLAFSAAQNNSDYLDSAYNLTFTFGGGIAPNTTIIAAPEPSALYPIGAVLFGGVFLITRKRKGSLNLSL